MKSLCLAVVVASAISSPFGPAFSQTVEDAKDFLPVAEQQKILEDAFKEVLQELPPDAAKRTRALCVGSWCSGLGTEPRPGARPTGEVPRGPGKFADLDITIDHPNKKYAELITARVNERIQEAASARGLRHKIKAVYAGDPGFDEFFRGDIGQAYVREYAWRNAPGGRATYTPKIENGKVTFEMTDAADFWKGVGKPVPARFSGVAGFVDDSARLFTKGRTGDVLKDALSAAKYMNNIEDIVKPGFSTHYGVPLPASLQLDETTKYQMRELLKVKGDTALDAAAREQRLMKIFAAGDDAQLLRTRLSEFVGRTESYFASTSERVVLFEGLVKSGALYKVANPSLVMEAAEKLAVTLKEHPYAAALDVGLLARHYALYGANKEFYEQLVLSGAMSMMPQAAIAAMVAAVAKDLGRAAGEFAVNATVFDAINDAMIQSSYTPGNAWYLFSSDLGGNPFGGYSRMTLACKYLGDRTTRGDLLLREIEPHLTVDVDSYVSALSAYRGLSGFTYADMGPADIRDRLLPHMMGDLKRSRDMWQAMGARETQLYATRTVTFPAHPALTVWVNNSDIEERTHPTFVQDVTTGKTVNFFVDVRREFAREISRNLPPQPGAVQAKWCEVGGDWNRYLKWEKSVLAEQEAFETPPAPVHIGITLRNTQGWHASTTIPVKVGAGAASGETNILGSSDYGRLQFATGTYRVTLSPTDQAKGPASVEIGFRLKDDATNVDESYAVTLTATPANPAAPTALSWADILERAIARVQNDRKPAAVSPTVLPPVATKPPVATTPRAGDQSPTLAACYKSEQDSYQAAVDWFPKIHDKNAFSHWAPDPQHSAQEVPPKACSDGYYATRNNPGMWEKAWDLLQECGWKAEIQKRKEALEKKKAECAHGR